MATRLMHQQFPSKPSDRHLEMHMPYIISEDIKAKEIFKDKIREVRSPLLEAEDDTSVSLEADANGAKTLTLIKR